MSSHLHPGLFGVISRNSRTDIGAIFSRIFNRTPDRFQKESLVDRQSQWAIGRRHLGVLQAAPQLCDNAAIHVLFHGDLYNSDEIRTRLGGEPQDGGSASSLIAALYEKMGMPFLSALDGVFSLALIDARSHRLILATDAVGSYPLYWTTTETGLAFGSHVGALLSHHGVRKQLDPAAVADYMTFGFPLAAKTLAAGVELLPCGSALSYDWDSGSANLSKYADVIEWFQPWTGSHSDYLDAVLDAFRRGVRRTLSGSGAISLALSGGLDSRAILGAVNGQCNTLHTYTLGVKACADEVIADKLARIAGTHHTFFELDHQYLEDFLPNLERLVDLTDGMYVSHGLTEMLALRFLSTSHLSVLLRGHGGELAKTSLAWPFHTDERVAGFHTANELLPYLMTRTGYVGTGANFATIFTDSWSRVTHDAAVESLAKSLEQVRLTPLDLCSYLYLVEYHRRVTTTSLDVFRTVVDVRLPFVDTGFLRVLFRGPAEWRSDTTIHRTLTAAGNGALLRVRNSNTGAPANAGPFVEFVLDKVNSAFKYLNLPGYRHYHNFQAWMREQLLGSVESVLLSPMSLDRGILRESGVRQLLNDTRQHRADHSYLLQVLLILELWQRQHL